ncbi:hypothetical protein K431DRAFT_287153 [Polychaeton citri CBS 116435]|uniref:Nap family protein n=1 Tax=Polychaeton citri CBS 116435 TaxID=1314669 RepID=A0A9P4Q3S4_9PEZI|nr:hypothetical protein K431DRAFT_287153 [Polychaeton citri CBS 116435]
MAEEAAPVSYEDLALIEDEFNDIDLDIMRIQFEKSKEVYQKRAAAVAKIPSFWPLVFEQVPLEIDQFILPQDSRLFAESLVSMEVTRPGIVAGEGEPRSLRFRFEFQPNEDFEDTVLEKSFWYRRAKDGYSGLVSEPVKIHWKKGKDLTQGLSDMAVALFEARKKAGDMTSKSVSEYAPLREKVEHWNGSNTSFFTWFGWVSDRRWISAEESEQANKKEEEKKKQRKEGQTVGEEEPSDEDLDEEDDQDVEVHEAGEQIAVTLAEEIWPKAIEFFTGAQEDEELSELDFEEDDEDMEDEDGPVDIRALVGDQGSKKSKRESGGAPPSKKQKK